VFDFDYLVIVSLLLLEQRFFVMLGRDRVVKTPYAVAHDTISEGSAASSNMPFATGAFYNGDAIFDPASAIAALQLGSAGGKKSGAFDTSSLRSQDETIRLVLLHFCYGIIVIYMRYLLIFILCIKIIQFVLNVEIKLILLMSYIQS
jgi:hypothetical protein